MIWFLSSFSASPCHSCNSQLANALIRVCVCTLLHSWGSIECVHPTGWYAILNDFILLQYIRCIEHYANDFRNDLRHNTKYIEQLTLSCWAHTLFAHLRDEDDVRDRARDLNYQIINHLIRETTQTNSSSNANKRRKGKYSEKQKQKQKVKQKEMKCHWMEVFPRLITLHQIAIDGEGEGATYVRSERASEIDSQITMHAVPVRKQINDSINGLLTTHWLIHLWRQWFSLCFFYFIKKWHRFFSENPIHSTKCSRMLHLIRVFGFVSHQIIDSKHV